MNILKFFLIVLVGDIVGGIIYRHLERYRYLRCKQGNCARCKHWFCKYYTGSEGES